MIKMPEENFITKEELNSILDERFGDYVSDFLDITNLIETVTTIPSHIPTRLYDQVKIYIDDIDSPTTKRFYIYSNKTNAWNYTTLT